jgi:hypothetical protein
VRIFTRATVVSCSVLALGSGMVRGDNGLTVSILNDSNDTLIVSVYDQSTKPPQQLVGDEAIYGNASVSVSLSPDSSGLGHLKWTAVTKDSDMRACGHGNKANLHDGDTVNVHADGQCGRRK